MKKRLFLLPLLMATCLTACGEETKTTSQPTHADIIQKRKDALSGVTNYSNWRIYDDSKTHKVVNVSIIDHNLNITTQSDSGMKSWKFIPRTIGNLNSYYLFDNNKYYGDRRTEFSLHVYVYDDEQLEYEELACVMHTVTYADTGNSEKDSDFVWVAKASTIAGLTL